MIAYFLFFFYLISGTFLLHILIRRKIFPFTRYHTVSIFFFRVFMGCLYGWIFLHYYGGDDTWNFFLESQQETNVLMKNPLLFFQEFTPAYSLQFTAGHGWPAVLFYIDHFERWFMIKGLAILNLFSGRNYYVNVLLFEFLTIPGPLLLFKMLTKTFPARAGIHFLLIFFIPTIIFWSSGIRAEAILLLSIVFMLYNGEAYARKKGLLRLTGIGAGLLGLLLFRYQLLLVILPAYIAYLISLYKQHASPRYFNQIYLAGGLLFMGSLFLSPDYQLSRPIRETQEKFFLLKGNTRYHLDTLNPGPVSFIKVLPQAFVNGALRPYPWEGKNLLQSVSSIEILFLLAGLCFFITQPQRRQQIAHPVFWLFLYYSISQLILIGYTVPFPGAIVRYRTIAFLMLFLFLYVGHPYLQQKLSYWIFKLH